MKTLLINSILSVTLLITLGACSKSETTDTTPSTVTDVVLTSGETLSCSDATSFSITPSEGNEPEITVTKNTSTGVTTIVYDSASGSATVIGCTKV